MKIKTANRRAQEMRTALPQAVRARYDRRLERVVIELSNKLAVMFAPQDAEGLEKATPAELEPIEISPSGFGIHFPKLDADLYLPALLEGFLGSRNWMAARLGAAGGRSRSAAKRKAAKKNGKLGGRPRKRLDELGEYAEGRNPRGYTEADVPRLIQEVRAGKPRRRNGVG